MGLVICTERVSRYMERECYEGLKRVGVWDATVRKFSSDLKEEFGEEDDEIMKIVELKKVEQGSKTMEEFV